MAYTIAEPRIDVKHTACVDVCPVDCIGPTSTEAEAFQQNDSSISSLRSALIAGPASLCVSQAIMVPLDQCLTY